MLRTIMVSVAVLALSGTAQADTVKQIWNQGLGEGNPGRIESPGECKQDDSSNFGCWNDSRDSQIDTDALDPAEEEEELPPTD